MQTVPSIPISRFKTPLESAAPPLTSFDADYVRRLREGEFETQRHFTRHFAPVLNIKLQRRVRSPQLREEVRQETFLRVLMIVRRGGVERPESLGGLVNSVCNHVLLEVFRKESRTPRMLETVPEPVDTAMGPESTLLSRQRESQVRAILERLPSKDRELLEQVFLEERDKDEVCRTYHVTRDYLRVMLHRAKARFRQTFNTANSPAITTEVQRHINLRRTPFIVPCE